MCDSAGISNFTCSHLELPNLLGIIRMSALADGLLSSVVASSAPESEISGSFQSGYDYSGTGIDRSGHGGHSGYDTEGVSSHLNLIAYTLNDVNLTTIH